MIREVKPGFAATQKRCVNMFRWETSMADDGWLSPVTRGPSVLGTNSLAVSSRPVLFPPYFVLS